MKNVTAIIKTFQRPDTVRRLVQSIRQYYPDLRIIVGDDSTEPQEVPGAELLALPFDIGLSAGRNRLVDAVETEYTLLLDDDFVFEPDTRIELLLKPLDDGLDLVSGRVGGCEYHGMLMRQDRTLHYLFRQKRRTVHGHDCYDMTWNFFVARTARLKELRWDEGLKVAEHTDFFLRGTMLPKPLLVGHVPEVNVGHIQEKNATYAKYRERGMYYAIRFFQKHDLVRSISYKGEEKTLVRYLAQYDAVKHTLAQH
jgi:glycosyltransferase involved in cell wall biosynthesis